ncbi:hypothetical protein SPD48_12710 [Pseudogracilibacillus sp. SE30717A]
MMKLMFILAAVATPIFAYFGKGATGILISLLFLLLAAFFSKPRFAKK